MTDINIAAETENWVEAVAAWQPAGGDDWDDDAPTPAAVKLHAIERRLIATPMPSPEGLALKLAMFMRTAATDSECRAEDLHNLLEGHIEGAAA